MTTAHQRDPTGYTCGAGHGCSLLACQPAEAATLAFMPRPCKCNWRLDQGIGDISGTNPLLSARPPNVIMAFWPLWQPNAMIIAGPAGARVPGGLLGGAGGR